MWSSKWVVLAAIGLAGCAANPYVGDTRPQAAPSAPLERGSLEYALAYADTTREAYRLQLSAEYNRKQFISGVVLTSAAVALGAAASHAHRDVIIAAVGGGGFVYQLGTWNASKEHELIFLEGMQAMSCLRAAVAPYRLTSAGRQRLDEAAWALRQAEVDTYRAQGRLRTRLHEALGQTGVQAETLAAARADLDRTAEQVKQAQQLGKAVESFLSKADSAGFDLEAQIDLAKIEIDKAHQKELKDLSELKAQIQGFSQVGDWIFPGTGAAYSAWNAQQATKIFPNAPLPGAASTTEFKKKGGDTGTGEPPAVSSAQRALAGALGDLEHARLILAAVAAELSGSLGTQADQAKTELAKCRPGGTGNVQSLKLTSATLAFAAGKAGRQSSTVSASQPPLRLRFLDELPVGIDPSIRGENEIVVKTDTTTVAGGSYRLLVLDRTDASAQLTVRIDDPAAATPAVDAPGAVQVCTGPNAGDKVLICLTQNLLKLPATGKLDTATCSAFINQLQPSGVVDAEARKLVLQKRGLDPQAKDADVLKALSGDEQTACGIAATGESRRAAPAAPRANPGATTAPSGAAGTTTAPPAAPAATGATAVPGARPGIESKLGLGEARALRRAVGLGETPAAFDADFRQALGVWQGKNQRPYTGGALTEEDAKRLLAQPAPR